MGEAADESLHKVMTRDELQAKLKDLPKTPGVYLHKNKSGKIIYIGKAAVLRNRVRQYFQKSRVRDPKTDALVAEIADTDWVEVETELDALFLEAELVRRYLPHYNILLRDDKSSMYVRIDINSSHPTASYTRRPLDDGAEYFGPYYNAGAVKRALKHLRRVFPYSTHYKAVPKRACLLYHLGLCPGIEENKTPLDEYKNSLRSLMRYLRGERTLLIRQAEKDMNNFAKKSQFEEAAQARNRFFALKSLKNQIVFSDKEFLDISKDQGLNELSEMLGLSAAPHRIEGYDISHMQGTDNVASMVVFSNGVPNKAAYRKFKMRLLGNDDFAHMHEALTRRLSEKNRKDWGVPDLILIDGGRGQLAAAIRARDEANLDTIPMIGLAKRDEEIIIHQTKTYAGFNTALLQKNDMYFVATDEFIRVQLPKSSHAVKLLQRIRDESHRFAVSYHSVLKVKRQTASLLDEIPTIGPATRKKLLKTFGSFKGITQARTMELEAAIGQKKTVILQQYLRAYKKGQK